MLGEISGGSSGNDGGGALSTSGSSAGSTFSGSSRPAASGPECPFPNIEGGGSILFELEDTGSTSNDLACCGRALSASAGAATALTAGSTLSSRPATVGVEDLLSKIGGDDSVLVEIGEDSSFGNDDAFSGHAPAASVGEATATPLTARPPLPG